jgi:hypothetical protein
MIVIHFCMMYQERTVAFCVMNYLILQARIQVALFNILQEGDIQIGI